MAAILVACVCKALRRENRTAGSKLAGVVRTMMSSRTGAETRVYMSDGKIGIAFAKARNSESQSHGSSAG